MLICLKELSVKREAGSLWQQGQDWALRFLWARAAAVPALQGLTCEFSKGVSVVLGPNGAGKSTLLQVLAGLVRPGAGQVTADGEIAGPEDLRQAAGYLPQAFGLYPSLTARAMLDYIALLKGITDRRRRECHVAAILQRTGLAAVADRRVGVFSRGMRQMVGIAQALLGDPAVLVLDEPTAGLDPAERNRVRSLLAEAGRERIVVFASSLIADTGCADQVLILDRGANRFWGTTAELAAYGMSRNGAFSPIGENPDNGDWTVAMEKGYRSILREWVSK